MKDPDPEVDRHESDSERSVRFRARFKRKDTRNQWIPGVHSLEGIEEA